MSMVSRRPVAARVTKRFSRGGSKRKTRWFGVSIFTNSLANGGNAIAIALDTRSNLELVGSTVVRTLGVFAARCVSSNNMANSSLVGGALMVVTSDAAGAGAGSIPDSLADADASWFWYQELVMQGNAGNEMNQLSMNHVDSKSKRKLGANMAIVSSFENQSNVSTDILLSVRFLIALP